MAEVCAVCGETFGFMTGLASGKSIAEELRATGVDVPTPICQYCASQYKLHGAAAKDTIQATMRPSGSVKKEIPVSVQQIPVSTINIYEGGGFTFVGPVSAHVALGTGPISQLLSSVTDFFGEQSESYNKKMEEAESACLLKLKQKTDGMGADAVIGLQTTYTELTHGHGMLLVSMIGTAIKKGTVQ